jgi:hypothetical protein
MIHNKQPFATENRLVEEKGLKDVHLKEGEQFIKDFSLKKYAWMTKFT